MASFHHRTGWYESDREFANVEGVLLYREVDRPLNSAYLIQGHRIQIATINLSGCVSDCPVFFKISDTQIGEDE